MKLSELRQHTIKHPVRKLQVRLVVDLGELGIHIVRGEATAVDHQRGNDVYCVTLKHGLDDWRKYYLVGDQNVVWVERQ